MAGEFWKLCGYNRKYAPIFNGAKKPGRRKRNPDDLDEERSTAIMPILELLFHDPET